MSRYLLCAVIACFIRPYSKREIDSSEGVADSSRYGWPVCSETTGRFATESVADFSSGVIGSCLVRTGSSFVAGTSRAKAGMVHHSGRGSQYCAADYRKVLKRHGIGVSMSRRGDCYDNAPMESFWGSLKSELVNHRRWSSRDEVKSAVVKYIEIFYNRQRRHSALGNLAPAVFAKKYEMERVSA